jgi:choline dehydrogenase-like flavoprotein
VWDVSGLFVGDGSAFPTPSGVNPQITIYGIAHMMAGGIAARWRAARKQQQLKRAEKKGLKAVSRA